MLRRWSLGKEQIEDERASSGRSYRAEEEDPPAALYLHAYPKLAIEEDPEDKQ